MKSWKPSASTIQGTNIYKIMKEVSIGSFEDFIGWSVGCKKQFWETTVEQLGIVFDKKYTEIVEVGNGVENAAWLYGAKLNITDSCFQNTDDAIAIVFDSGNGNIQKISQKDLDYKVNALANGLVEYGLIVGDTVAIYMSMTIEAVVVYLAAIKAGVVVVTVADSFSSEEVAIRLDITKPKLVFTQDGFTRAGRMHLLYDKCVKTGITNCIVVKYLEGEINLDNESILYKDFISANTKFNSVKVSPDKIITILFSSGTTGEPKAIPWNHTTPIKLASDGFYHHDIKCGDVVCWPTNMGWMMGPWLVFATLINKGTIALYSGSPLEEGFGKFVENSKVNMLGLVPSIVRSWKLSGVMQEYDWNAIRCFSSTGEVSNSEDMSYLMELGGEKPIIEYCGGTEIGGGYVASTMVQENIPSQFSCQTLGGEFILLNDKGEESRKGEVFIVPPIMGLSTDLINKNHHETYYKDVPKYKGKILRNHGDEFRIASNGYFIANGRVDDTMNLGGIKVSSIQIERVVNSLGFVKESAAISVSPKKGGPSDLVIYFVALYTIDENEALRKVQNCVKRKLNPLFKVVDLVKIDTLPRTASNKVKRKELRTIYQNL
jgi:acetyl-CoA synthetase